jgi:hypothetical protein
MRVPAHARESGEMLLTGSAVGLSWVSVNERLPLDCSECVLLCHSSDTNKLTKSIGRRLHGHWKTQESAFANYEVLAWLKIPSIPSNIPWDPLWGDRTQ